MTAASPKKLKSRLRLEETISTHQQRYGQVPRTPRSRQHERESRDPGSPGTQRRLRAGTKQLGISRTGTTNPHPILFVAKRGVLGQHPVESKETALVTHVTHLKETRFAVMQLGSAVIATSASEPKHSGAKMLLPHRPPSVSPQRPPTRKKEKCDEQLHGRDQNPTDLGRKTGGALGQQHGSQKSRPSKMLAAAIKQDDKQTFQNHLLRTEDEQAWTFPSPNSGTGAPDHWEDCSSVAFSLSWRWARNLLTLRTCQDEFWHKKTGGQHSWKRSSSNPILGERR